MSEWVDVAPASEFAPGSRRHVEVDGVPVLVFNLAGEYFAIEDVCSHDGNPLDDGPIEADEIICPRHGARFCIRTGQVKGPPAYVDIATLAVREYGGTIQVRDERWD